MSKEFLFRVVETCERKIIIEANSLEEAENIYMESDEDADFEEISCMWTGAKIIDKKEY